MKTCLQNPKPETIVEQASSLPVRGASLPRELTLFERAGLLGTFISQGKPRGPGGPSKMPLIRRSAFNVRCSMFGVFLILFSTLDPELSTVHASTFTVISTNDSGAGSLRDALTQANATSGADIIAFNLTGPTRTINVSNALPDITESVTIDGSTQPGFAGTPVIELNGQSAGAGGVDGLRIVTTNSVIRALVINRFTGDGIEIATNGNNAVEGCYLGLNLTGATDLGNTQNGVSITNSANNVIGGIFSTQRNFISGNNGAGIQVGGLFATNNQILGNVVGLNVTNNPVANSGGGVRINASLNTIGGSSGGARNFISGNSGNGIELLGATNSGNRILGNYIGPDLTGLLDRGNGSDGVLANNSGGHQIGGSNPGEGNVISGNNSDGIELNGLAATNMIVRGNLIGTDSGGAGAIANGAHGVFITSNSRSNAVGGVLTGQPNVISFNVQDGISVAAANSNTNNTFRGNSIFSNGDLGVDLGNSGVQANDAGDPDVGANALQNFPELTAATNHGSSVTIAGSLRSTPNTQFTLDFYANVLFDPSSNGEGQFYLGSTNVTTAANSNVSFTVVLPTGLSGRYVSATATDPFGNTSEFSTNIVAFSTVTTNTFIVSNTNESGAGSLREAINGANQSITAAPDLIAFAIPGAGPHIIAPSNALPPLADSVILDGYTQSGASPNSLAVGNNAVLQIRLDGINTPNNVPGLSLWGGNSTVRGLSITRFKSGFGHGIEVFSANNVISGNFIGVPPDGITDLGNGGDGIFISGAGNNLIGGTTPAARNVIGGNGGDAVEISGATASGNTIQGNYIGTSATGVRGTVDLGNGSGINLNNAPGTLVGGIAASAGNVIADNAGAGISTGSASATNNVIQGNLIGTDVNGAALGNNSSGINIASSRNTIGGVGAGEANTIAYNNGDGVSISSGTNNVTRGNSIYDNGGATVGNLGIDLGASGVLPNDSPDAVTGANLQQNYPYLTNATANPANTQVLGELRSRSNLTYQIDFYSNVTGDPSTNGEGQKWLGAVTVVTDGTSNAVINATVPAVAFGRYISATATDPFGNTSEFSTNVVAGSTIPPATFTVVNTNDSGPGSLRAAISNANAFVSSGNDLIAFNIPGSGPHVIAITNALPALTDFVTIDGYTQPGAQTNNLADGNNAILKIQLSGTNAPNNVDGLRLEANGCVVRGLAIVGFKGSGDGIEIVSTGNVIEGCFIGLQTDGTNVSANAGNGILISGAANTIGGATTGARNVISGNGGDGVELSGVAASNNIVAGSFIGTDASGAQDKGNNGDGVLVTGAPGNVIGGDTATSRNVISGNQSEGITIQNTTATNNQVLNNYIGADVTGALALGNNSHGVQFASGFPSGNQIGSPNPGGNLIAFNNGDGVFVSVGTNNAIRANSIHNNGGATLANLGIDLGASGVLINDFPDVATGANLQQNYPILSGAVAHPSSTTVQGTLSSRPSTTYAVDFFSSLAGDPAGNGEGQKWLGSTNLTTDANGTNVFNVTVSGVVQGRFITATATDPNGNTSEFSPWIRAGSTIAPKTFTVLNTNDSGAGSLRAAILLGNLEVSSTNNLIQFNITTPEPHVISLASALPVPTEAVTIDGYTQTGAAANTISNGNNAILKIRLDGAGAPFGTDALPLTAAGGNVIRGLSITRFGDAIELGTNGNNRIEGNFLGVGLDGVTAFANFNYGVTANNSPGNLIGGSTPAARNVISGNNTGGILLTGAGAVNNRVEGNFIGTDFTGSLDLGNTGPGVTLTSASTNVIGGTNAAVRNVVSGNNSGGILISGASQANAIQGNFIGTDVTGGAAVGNNSGGVTVALSTFPSVEGNLIGGTNAAAGNRIAFNFGPGVLVSNGTNNAILANNIFSNSTLGIDLGFDSNVTPNDAGDPDTGPNQFQNFPILAAATITPANTTIQGSLNSRPSTTYRLDFFANLTRDPVFPNGEGQQYLGSTNVATGADSNANFNVTLPAVAVGRHITATATDPFGNTSEFSSAVAAASTFPPVTFVVTNTLNQGPGSLMQAILNNNATPTATNNVITFNIPGSGPHTIAPTSALPAIVESVTLDGFTQPGSSSNSLAIGNNAVWQIRISGTNAGGGVRGLAFTSSSNIVRGLVINGFRNNGIELSTPGNTIIGNVIGLELDSSIQSNQGQGVLVTAGNNRIGGTLPADRNVISGNSFEGVFLSGVSATNNRVEGNFIGTGIGGVLDRGNFNRGIQVSGGSSNRIGGAIAGAGNVISGNSFNGISISQGNGTVMQGNFIGTDVTGTILLGNSSGGVSVQQSTNVLIGGNNVAARNLISGNPQYGVYLGFAAESARVTGNLIGTDVTGTQPIGNTTGIIIESSLNAIGGVAAGEANVVAFNFSMGVQVSSGTNNAIRANSIFGHTQLGIDLGLFSGVTSNDVADVDAGPNHFQNFPILTNAVANVGNTLAQGSLNSRPSTTYQLDFFSNEAGHTSGHGEGQRYLGTTNVTTDGAGNVSFSFAGAALISGRFITATATDPDGNTSEFSLWFRAASTIPPAAFTVVNTNDSGTGSLRQAILNVDVLPSAGNDVIRFAIPGPGVRTIAPLTPLPIPQDPITIDGFTQSGSSSNTLVEGYNAVLLIRLDGTNVQFAATGLDLTNGNNVIRGLEVFRFGGHGIDLNSGSSNLVAGCLVWSNGFDGIELAGQGNRIGGTTPGARNVISGNNSYGIEILGAPASNNVVQGNFIGTDITGGLALGNRIGGVRVNAASFNLIGNSAGGTGGISPAGFAPVVRNVISGNGGPGLRLEGFDPTSPNGNRILDNYIGTDVLGLSGVTNRAEGILLAGAINTTIGGTNGSDANLIAFNQTDAVRVSSGTNNNVQGNSMFNNGDLGIDLGLGGVAFNDPGDLDTGANQLQNFPVLTNALITSSNLIVQGTLNSRPNTSYRLDFYSNTECDISGNGEGRRWLGSATVLTGADSNAVVNVSLPPVYEGRFITATATDPNNNTSEFCACVQLLSAQPPLDLVVTNTNDSGPGSLRQAILDNNAAFTSTNNLIRFLISGAGVKTIAVLSQLPTITEPVIIDGFTQPGAMADIPGDGTNTVIWLIRLDGSNAGPGPVDGLHLTSSSNLLRGLVIVNFTDDGIELESGNGTVIAECLIGIDVDATGFPPPTPLPIPQPTGGLGGGDEVKAAGGGSNGGNKTDVNMKGSSNNSIDEKTSTGHSSGPSICVDGPSRDNRAKGKMGRKPTKKHSKKNSEKSQSRKAPIGGSAVKNGGPGTEVSGAIGPTGAAKVQTDPEFQFTGKIEPSSVEADGQPTHQRGAGTLPNNPPFASATITQAVNQAVSTIIRGIIRGLPSAPIAVDIYAKEPGGTTWSHVGQQVVTPNSSGTGVVNTTVSRLPEGTQIKNIANNDLVGASQDSTITTVEDSSFPDADLKATKRSFPNPVVVGSNLVYTITVTNCGPNTATNVQVQDILPPGVTVVRTNSTHGTGFATGNVRIFTGITLTNGEVATIEIEVTVTNTITLTNLVGVGGSVDDTNIVNNADTNVTAVVTSPPTGADLTLTKTSSTNSVEAGSTVTYYIVVTNRGPFTATNAQVTDTFPAGTTVQGEFTDHGSIVDPGNNQRTINLGSLTNGEVATIVFLVRYTNAGTFTNFATVTSAATDSNTANNADTEVTTVTPPPPSTVQFNQSAFIVNEGQNAQIVVTRTGNTNGTVTVPVSVVHGSAKNPEDYTSTLLVEVRFNPGETQKTFSIPTVGDTNAEPDEILLLVLGQPVGPASLGNPASAWVNILNDDGPPVDNLLIGVVPGPFGIPIIIWSDRFVLQYAFDPNGPWTTLIGASSPFFGGDPNDLTFTFDGLLGLPAVYFRVARIQAPCTGTIVGTVRDGDGNPIPGAVVRVGDGALVGATDGNGNFIIPNVPPGTVPLNFVKVVGLSNEFTGQIEYVEAQITVNVAVICAIIPVNVKLDLPKELPKPPCNCTPTCGIVGGTFDGVQKVVAGGGKRGVCAEAPVVTVTGPGGINEVLTTKRKTYSPAANGTWTVTVTICGRTKVCTITLP